MIKNKKVNRIGQKIGLLDSGVGGLSILSELIKVLPQNNYIYFGDTKNVPYGSKTPEQILSYTKDILDFFAQNHVSDVVIACNTTSAVAYDDLKEIFKNKLNIIPLIQTAAPNAVLGLENNDRLAVLATNATIKSKKYEEELKKANPNIEILALPGDGFVEIVEKRLYEDKKSFEIIKEKLDIIRDFNAKRIILGCTHYPYLVNIFKKILDVEYFNPAYCIAKVVKNKIEQQKDGKIEFYVSKNPDEFILSARTFFNVKEAKLINLDD